MNHRRAARWLAGCVGLLVLAGGCGDTRTAADLSDTELREALFSQFVEDDLMSESTANCLVGFMFDNTDREELNRLADAEDVEELSDADVRFLTEGIEACR